MTVLSHVHREEFQQVAGMLDGCIVREGEGWGGKGMTTCRNIHQYISRRKAKRLTSEQQVEEEIGLFRAGHVVLNVLINDNQGSIQLFRVLHTGQGRVYDIHFPISQSKIQGVDTNGALLPAVEIAQALRKRSSIENNHVVDEILCGCAKKKTHTPIACTPTFLHRDTKANEH